MDFTFVLEDEVSISVEELLIISAVEAIVIAADGIELPQLEAYASQRSAAGEPSYAINRRLVERPGNLKQEPPC